MFELKAKEYKGNRVIDSRDVAVMVERNHNELLKSIRNYIGYLREGDFAQSNFFIESTYLNAQNHESPNFLITKKGCDMIANKTTGKKGVLFTAAYVTAFNEMQENIHSNPAIPPSVSPSGLAQLIRITRRVMLDMGSTPNDVGQMMCGLYQTWSVPVPSALKNQVPGQFSLFDSSSLMVEGGNR